MTKLDFKWCVKEGMEARNIHSSEGDGVTISRRAGHRSES